MEAIKKFKGEIGIVSFMLVTMFSIYYVFNNTWGWHMKLIVDKANAQIIDKANIQTSKGGK